MGRIAFLVLMIAWLFMLGLRWSSESPTQAVELAVAPFAGNAPAAVQASMAALEETTNATGEINFRLLRQVQLVRGLPPAFPRELEALDGKQVTMRGFMSPFDSLRDMRNFMMMSIPTGCYFCVPPSEKEVVFVRQETTETAPYISGPIEVVGTLNLWHEDSEEMAHEGFMYVIDNATAVAYKGKGDGDPTLAGPTDDATAELDDLPLHFQMHGGGGF